MGTTTKLTDKHRASSSKKRTRDQMLDSQINGSVRKPIEVSDDDHTHPSPKKVKKSQPASNGEKRLKRWRTKMPVQWQERLERALHQRMFVVDRKREDVEGVPQETVELVGSTGNVYSVTIKQIPSCTCPDSRKGNICKHIIYVLRLVLKAPPELEYQMSFLQSELKQIFDGSPIPQIGSSQGRPDESNRKAIEGDCPICFMEFEPESEEIVWCRSACGNNIHKECFEKWAKSQGGKEVRCVYCRSTWKGDDPSIDRIRAAKAKQSVNSEGYVNLASELGISRYRDTSTYHSFWVNRQYRDGHTFDTD